MARSFTDKELFEALAPVKRHFKGSSVNGNTVLAAYMREREINPAGPAWLLAKAALDSGASFTEAAATTETQGRREASEATPQHNEEMGRLSSLADGVQSMRLPPRTAVSKPIGNSPTALTWFPKKFAPGDMNGQGAQRLLGTPNIPLTSVLVREMAQNSWDARTGNSAVRFTMNLRKLSADETRILRDRIFTGRATGLGLRNSLDKDELWGLEIADRGTKGLGGPVRNDVAIRPDQVTNFADLILTLGAPRDVSLGAGTYGFGKTVAYRASTCGTVLFWSRSREDAGVEDRLIGSAFGKAFNDHGLAYTGRHWWGREVDDRIEPVRGADASVLARSVFAQGFEVDETGTSMLIIDPDLGVGTPEETIESLADAALWHLWPKMANAGIGRTQMLIETMIDGRAIEPVPPEEHPLFGGFTDCLMQVRSAQSAGSYTPMFNTITHEVWLERPRTLLGHLALTRFPYSDGGVAENEVAAFEGPSHHVALMRHDAELVVKYLSGEPLNAPGFQWAGVFKPVAETDNSFADAEPPAHDDWSPAAITDKAKKREVNVAIRRIKTIIADFLGPINVGAGSHSQGRSVAGLADQLAGLLNGLHGPAPMPTSPKGRGPRTTRRKAAARVQKTWTSPTAAGRRIMALRVGVEGSERPVRVRAEAGVGVEGAMDHDESRVMVLGWVPGGDDPDLTVDPVPSEPSLGKGDTQWLVLDADSSVAVDVNLVLGPDGS